MVVLAVLGVALSCMNTIPRFPLTCGIASGYNMGFKYICAYKFWLMGEVNWLFNVTINDISVIYVTAHRCAGGLKKLDLRSGSQRHRHFVGFFYVPVLAPTRDHPFYTVIPTHRPI